MFWRLYSYLWRLQARLRGASVGRCFRAEGLVKVTLRDGARYKNICIGDHVSCMGNLFLRIRNDTTITIGHGVSIGREVWLVGANGKPFVLEDNVQIGSYVILNGGHGLRIGRDSWLAGFVYINTSDHKTAPGELIRQQGYTGAPVEIGADNWIGGHVFICKGVTTADGVVVGAGTVLTKSMPTNAIVVGNPGRILKYR